MRLWQCHENAERLLTAIWEAPTPEAARDVMNGSQIQEALVPGFFEFEGVARRFRRAIDRATFVLDREFWDNGWVNPSDTQFQFEEDWKRCLALEINRAYSGGEAP